MNDSIKDQLLLYKKAAYPVIYLVTHEERRAEALLANVALDRTEQNIQTKVYVWSVTQGWREGTRQVNDATDPVGALKAITAFDMAAIVVLRDFHFYLPQPEVLRTFRDLIPHLKAMGKMAVILAPRQVIPTELEKDVTVLTLPLPAREDLDKGVSRFIERSLKNNAKVTDRSRLLDALSGLSFIEAENALALAWCRHQAFDLAAVETIQQEKAQAVKKSGFLDLIETKDTMESVGGLENLKEWLRRRVQAYSEKAREFGILPPRGILLVGPPGCGKSLTAKAVARAWGLPLIRFDVGRVFGSLVGQSEENTRKAIQTAEAMSPVVLWMDEIEKGLAGTGSSGVTDSGVTSRVFGSLLTWLSDKTAPVFVVATANDVRKFDGTPELLRKGRFDEIFAVDLPTATERAEIFRIHVGRRNRKPEAFDVEALAGDSEGYSGAEIEQAIMEGMFTAFDLGRDLETKDIALAIRATTPLSVTMKESIQRVRAWAKLRARAAAAGDELVPLADERRMIG